MNDDSLDKDLDKFEKEGKFLEEYADLVEQKEEGGLKFKLMEEFAHPWQVILAGGKNGIRSVLKFLFVSFLFVIANAVLLFYSLNLFFGKQGTGTFSHVLIVFLLGLGFTLYAFYRAYQYVIIDMFRIAYEHLSNYFHNLCSFIIDKVQEIFKKDAVIKDVDLAKAVNFSKMVDERFSKLPWLLRKGIKLALNQVPVVGMIGEVKQEVLSGNKEQATDKLYDELDSFIMDGFGANTLKWFLWLLPLNVFIVMVFIRWKFGL